MTIRRLQLVVNPFSGRHRGTEVADRVVEFCGSRGIAVERHDTEARGHGRELASTLELEPDDAVVAVGGDGTLNEVVCGLRSRTDGIDVAVAIAPAGAGNALAADLGIHGVGDTLGVIASGRTRSVDLARVALDGTPTWAFNVVAWGLAAEINARGEAVRWLGRQRYTAGALLELARPCLRPIPYTHGNGSVVADALISAACLTRTVGAGMCLAPQASLDDGLFELVTIRRAPRLVLLRLLGRVMRGEHTDSPHVSIERLARLDVVLDREVRVLVDGELYRARRIDVEVVERGLRVLA